MLVRKNLFIKFKGFFAISLTLFLLSELLQNNSFASDSIGNVDLGVGSASKRKVRPKGSSKDKKSGETVKRIRSSTLEHFEPTSAEEPVFIPPNIPPDLNLLEDGTHQQYPAKWMLDELGDGDKELESHLQSYAMGQQCYMLQQQLIASQEALGSRDKEVRLAEEEKIKLTQKVFDLEKELEYQHAKFETMRQHLLSMQNQIRATEDAARKSNSSLEEQNIELRRRVINHQQSLSQLEESLAALKKFQISLVSLTARQIDALENELSFSKASLGVAHSVISSLAAIEQLTPQSRAHLNQYLGLNNAPVPNPQVLLQNVQHICRSAQ